MDFPFIDSRVLTGMTRRKTIKPIKKKQKKTWKPVPTEKVFGHPFIDHDREIVYIIKL